MKCSAFHLPSTQEGDETVDGLPVTKLAEERSIVGRMLLLCYPHNVRREEVQVQSEDDAVALLLGALTKYQMDRSHHCR